MIFYRHIPVTFLSKTCGILQADPENFWNIFYTVMFVLMMLYFYKTRRRSDWDLDDDIEVCIGTQLHGEGCMEIKVGNQYNIRKREKGKQGTYFLCWGINRNKLECAMKTEQTAQMLWLVWVFYVSLDLFFYEVVCNWCVAHCFQNSLLAATRYFFIKKSREFQNEREKREGNWDTHFH